MPFQTACPFCNSAVVTEREEARTNCPRCGESFAAQEWQATNDAVSTVSTQPASSFPRIVLVIVAVIAVLAVPLLLIRPWETPQPVPVEPLAGPATTLPPTALVGLRYMPSTSNVIIAIQSAALAGFNPQQPPRKVLASAGVPESILATFEKAGVPLEDVEQIVAGLTVVPDRLIPGVTVFVKFRKPKAEEAFLNALQAERKPTSGRAIYISKFNNLLLTPIDDKSWLFGLIDDDLMTADKPAKSLDHLSQTIRLAMSERLDPATYAMLVTGEAKWSEANAFVVMSLKKAATKLAKGRSLAMGISQTAEGPLLKLSIDTIDSAAAIEVRDVLRAKLGDKATVESDGSRVNVSMHESLPNLGTLLRGLFYDFKK